MSASSPLHLTYVIKQREIKITTPSKTVYYSGVEVHAFEKEKFEYYKKQLNESNNKQSVQMSYGCEVPCRHDWVYDCSVVDILGRKERHRCRLCGEFKTVETARMV